MPRYARGLWKMARPLFLLGTLPIYFLGAAAAWRDTHSLQPALLALGMLELWLVQLLTHYSNEYRDLETDLATAVPTRISGGSRVLVKGLASRSAARVAAVTSLLAAISLAVFLVVVMGAGPLAPALAGAAIVLGWSYSNPPLRLQSRGLGEAAVTLVAGLLTPLWSYYLQTSAVSPGLLMACLPLVFIIPALALATGLPDIAADEATGKATLAVRLGAIRTLRLAKAMLLAGWTAYAFMAFRIWPFWGGLSAVIILPCLIASTAIGKGRVGPSIASQEKLGLIAAFLAGYVAAGLGFGLIFA